MKMQTDNLFMKKALQLAEKGAGFVSPNPKVGCIIVNKDGKIIGNGYHEKYGEAHAEVNAVHSVKDKTELEGATVYVSLEPCSHHGKTPPCTDLLTSLPIKRVVLALKDPNPLVSGRGIQKLREANIEVEIGVCETESRLLNEFFLHHMQTGKPFVCLKIAQTLDGFSAAEDGSSQWITGKLSRTLVHEWRAKYDAVLVGRNTALHDNPSLTVRLVKGRNPFRIVLDGPGNLPKNLRLFTDQFEEKTIHIVGVHNVVDDVSLMLATLKGDEFRGKTLVAGMKNGHVDVNEALIQLGKMGFSSILVEAGPNLASALIREKLVDKLACFIAPKLLGSGKRPISDLGISTITQALELKNVSWEKIGDDMVMMGEF